MKYFIHVIQAIAAIVALFGAQKGMEWCFPTIGGPGSNLMATVYSAFPAIPSFRQPTPSVPADSPPVPSPRPEDALDNNTIWAAFSSCDGSHSYAQVSSDPESDYADQTSNIHADNSESSPKSSSLIRKIRNGSNRVWNGYSFYCGVFGLFALPLGLLCLLSKRIRSFHEVRLALCDASQSIFAQLEADHESHAAAVSNLHDDMDQKFLNHKTQVGRTVEYCVKKVDRGDHM